MGEIRVKSEIPYTDGWKRGAYAYANGNYTANATAYVCSEKIPCEHNANYNFICTLPDGSKDHGFLFWDKNGVFLGEIHNTAGAQTSPVSFTVETPTNCATLAINISTPTGYGNRYTEDILSFNLYSWQALPSHEKTSTGWKDIPTHTMTANGWQGELTSQSPLEFRATGQSLLDWRIDGASGGVGDWDETEQKYKIPVTVNDTTTNLYTTAQLMDGDSLDYTTDQTVIPITQGDNTLTVLTQVQPKSVFVKFEG